MCCVPRAVIYGCKTKQKETSLDGRVQSSTSIDARVRTADLEMEDDFLDMREFTRITDVRIRELEMEEFFLDMGEFR